MNTWTLTLRRHDDIAICCCCCCRRGGSSSNRWSLLATVATRSRAVARKVVGSRVASRRSSTIAPGRAGNMGTPTAASTGHHYRRKRSIFVDRGIISALAVVLAATAIGVALQAFVLPRAFLFAAYNDNGAGSNKSMTVGSTAAATTTAKKPTVESSNRYVSSFRQSFGSPAPSRRPLLALHVPKTAGEALEEAARKRDVHWGWCRFPLSKNGGARGYRYCRGSPPFAAGGTWPIHTIDFWHIPRQYFPFKAVDPYLDAEIFVTVRDPFRRLVSEFYYQCAPRCVLSAVSGQRDVVSGNDLCTPRILFYADLGFYLFLFFWWL